MVFLVVGAGVVVFSLLGSRIIKAHAGLFYLSALVLDGLFIACLFLEMPPVVKGALFALMQKGALATALFTLVMYLGVLSRDSGVSIRLRPIRAELSILAGILSLGHVVMYGYFYAERFLLATLQVSVALALTTALVLLVLLLILEVTSIDAIKRRMNADRWKHVQLLAYPFFGLVYVHLMFMLLPAALAGGLAARTSVLVYSVVFVNYAILRLRRLLAERSSACVQKNPVSATDA